LRKLKYDTGRRGLTFAWKTEIVRVGIGGSDPREEIDQPRRERHCPLAGPHDPGLLFVLLVSPATRGHNRASPGEVAAVDRQDCACYEGGLVGGEERDRLGDFLWLAQSAHWVHPLDLLDVLASARLLRQS
jgi:hypothetical protein